MVSGHSVGSECSSVSPMAMQRMLPTPALAGSESYSRNRTEIDVIHMIRQFRVAGSPPARAPCRPSRPVLAGRQRQPIQLG